MLVDGESEKEILDDDGQMIAKLSWTVDGGRNNSPSAYKMISIFLSNEQNEIGKENENGEKPSFMENKNTRKPDDYLPTPDSAACRKGEHVPWDGDFAGWEFAAGGGALLGDDL